MSLNNKQYKEMILKYHQNKLSNSERHQLEMDAMDDPFLSDALDGFELDTNPVHLEEIESQVQHQMNAGGGSSFYSLFIAPAVVLVGISLVFNPLFIEEHDADHHEDHPVQIAQNDDSHFQEKTNSNEIVIEDKQLEAAQELPKKEWLERISEIIKASDTEKIVTNEDDKTTYNYTPIRPVKVDAPVKIKDTIEIKKELKKYQHPVYFLSDLKVANYRNFRSGDLWTEEFNNSVSAQYENNVNKFEENPTTALETGENNKVSYTDFLEDCMKDYSKGKIKLALRGYKTILKNYPDDANALFYGGLSAYNLGLTERAIELLEKSFNHPYNVFKEESEWLLSLALLKSGNKERSLEIMHSISNGDHFYADRARRKISELED